MFRGVRSAPGHENAQDDRVHHPEEGKCQELLLEYDPLAYQHAERTSEQQPDDEKDQHANLLVGEVPTSIISFISTIVNSRWRHDKIG